MGIKMCFTSLDFPLDLFTMHRLVFVSKTPRILYFVGIALEDCSPQIVEAAVNQLSEYVKQMAYIISKKSKTLPTDDLQT